MSYNQSDQSPKRALSRSFVNHGYSGRLQLSRSVKVAFSILATLHTAFHFTGCGANGMPAKEALNSIAKSPADAPSAVDIIDAAIEAHGAHAVDQIEAGEMTVFIRGYVTRDLHDEITTISAFQRPDQIRESTEHSVGESTSKRDYVRDGIRAWRKDDGEQRQPTTELKRIEDLYPLRLFEELRLLRETGSALKFAGEKVIDEQTLLVIRLAQGGNATSEVYFDKSTKLLAGISTPQYNPRTGELGKSESYYSDYRSFDGLTLPRVMVEFIDGEKFVEKTLQEFTAKAPIDPKNFIPGA